MRRCWHTEAQVEKHIRTKEAVLCPDRRQGCKGGCGGRCAWRLRISKPGEFQPTAIVFCEDNGEVI